MSNLDRYVVLTGAPHADAPVAVATVTIGAERFALDDDARDPVLRVFGLDGALLAVVQSVADGTARRYAVDAGALPSGACVIRIGRVRGTVVVVP